MPWFGPGLLNGHALGRSQDEDVHRALHVLGRVVAQVLERAWHLPDHIVAYRGRESDAANRRHRLQPRGDVDAFAVDVVAVDDDIAEVDSDAIEDALCFGELRFDTSGCLLDRQCAVDRGDNTGELDQCAVAHELDQASTVGSDAGIEDLASVDLQPFERLGLGRLHQSAVAGDVG